MKKLTGQVAVVTGAARGPKAALGSVFVQALAAEGAIVVAADVNDCSDIVSDIHDGGGLGLAVRLDVADEAAVQRVFEQTAERFGRVDILVNNAAVGSNTPPVPLEQLSVQAWDQLMATNVRGPFVCAKAAFPFMQRNGYGKIINVGSTAIIEGLTQRLHYVTAKGAIMAMTRALAKELGPYGIRVNTLAPGLVMNPAVEAAMAARPGLLQRVRESRALRQDMMAHDVVGTLLFLASRDSDAVSGQFIVVDNGAAFS